MPSWAAGDLKLQVSTVWENGHGPPLSPEGFITRWGGGSTAPLLKSGLQIDPRPPGPEHDPDRLMNLLWHRAGVSRERVQKTTNWKRVARPQGPSTLNTVKQNKSRRFVVGDDGRSASSISPRAHSGDGCHPGVHLNRSNTHRQHQAWDEPGGVQFDSDDDVITAVEHFLKVQHRLLQKTGDLYASRLTPTSF